MPEINTQTLPSYEDMVRSGMHFGRKKSIFHPNMRPYIYTMKDTVYIIDLLKTEQGIKDAIEAMRKVIDAGGLILFIGLTAQSVDPVKQIAEDLKMPYVVNR